MLLGYSDCLMATDEILRNMLVQPEFQKEMGTAELHYLLGKYCAEWERKAGLKDVSVLAAAYRAGVPCYTSSPGDSTIGMNVAGVELRGNKLRLNPSIDVNETTAFVLAAKRAGGKSAVVLWGGGSPKNFMLQTEPQIQEVLRIKEYGQDYFLQVTDARPDTGGLSGATPSEAVSWGKVDPDRLPDAVVCYTDTTIAMPLLTHYALARHKPRKLKRLYDQRAQDGQSADQGILHPQQGEDDRRQRAGYVVETASTMADTMPRTATHHNCYIIAGPNGAGKTTFATKFLPVSPGARTSSILTCWLVPALWTHSRKPPHALPPAARHAAFF